MTFKTRNRSLALCLAWIASIAMAAGGLQPAQAAWQQTLQARDLTGDGMADAYYDTDLDITWLRDATFARTSGFDADANLWFPQALAWTSALDFNGIGHWRLPRFHPVNGTQADLSPQTNDGSTDIGYGGTASELGHLYYVTLRNTGHCARRPTRPGSCEVNPRAGLLQLGPFQLTRSEREREWFWMDGEPVGGQWPWFLSFDATDRPGMQSYSIPKGDLMAWAVHDGDVGTPVPEARSLLMMLAGLGLLAWHVRRPPMRHAAARGPIRHA